jgi:ketosteroid isomerase-like protein
MSESNVQLAQVGFEAAMRGDFDAIEELLDPSVKWHGGDPSAHGACGNRDEALAFMRKARARGRIGELVEVIDAGEKVIVVMRPASPSGKLARLRANLSTFKDGKVIEMVAYETPEDALAAAGRHSPPQRPGAVSQR